MASMTKVAKAKGAIMEFIFDAVSISKKKNGELVFRAIPHPKAKRREQKRMMDGELPPIDTGPDDPGPSDCRVRVVIGPGHPPGGSITCVAHNCDSGCKQRKKKKRFPPGTIEHWCDCI